GVVVRDEGDRAVGDRGLPGQDGLGVVGHVYHVPAHLAEPTGLGPRAEARALDHDDGPAVVDGDPTGPTGLEQGLADPFVVGIGEGLVVGGRAVVVGVGPAPGAVDELVED